jgi:hypothetical protein
MDVQFVAIKLPNGQRYALNGSLTDLSTKSGKSDNEGTVSANKTSHRKAKFIGGSAAGGAVIGAIAGGGKGAAIGAGSRGTRRRHHRTREKGSRGKSRLRYRVRRNSQSESLLTQVLKKLNQLGKRG